MFDIRDQSVFITWVGPEEFMGGGFTRNWVAKRGTVNHLKILLRGAGGQKIYTVHLNLQYLFLIVNMTLQKTDCIATSRNS